MIKKLLPDRQLSFKCLPIKYSKRINMYESQTGVNLTFCKIKKKKNVITITIAKS